MSVNRLIEDMMIGDEKSKSELKLAYRKAFRVGAWAAGILFILCIWLTFFLYPNAFFGIGINDSMLLWLIPKLFFSILVPLVLGAFIGSQSLNFFIRHIKITLPEALTPKVSLKSNLKK